ncbi:hypothetical protein CTheo_4974 [Ceratobasidium theobromae]|uniref:F-box domain-containing protein n=1 Tax=Ceratobasidium theobromae TaxID=1582974 RepID=A0A5N5QIL5_9AGAM|nr:hypothetical protein CTheo_4974 [Ceratobasidium theobromae]
MSRGRSHPQIQKRSESDVSAEDPLVSKLFAILPLELLIEVAKYLSPLDLLRLSRTVLRNVEGLPPCPKSLCEPQYAAMLFLDECSMCSRPTTNDMDAVLLVRLCDYCLQDEVCDMDQRPRTIIQQSLLFISTEPVVGKREHKKWFLMNQAKEIQAKYKELLESGDINTLDWVKKRHKLVADRKNVLGSQKAKPLTEWIRNSQTQRKMEREEEMRRLKTLHREEIEARLPKLGWDRTDFHQLGNTKLKWANLVSVPKLLDDQAKPKPVETFSGPPVATLRNDNQDINIELTVLDSPFPSASVFMSWPEVMALLGTDIPMETFEAQLKDQQARLMQLINDWHDTWKRALLEELPKDTLPIDTQNIECDLTTGTQGRSLDCLPMEVKQLLRADAIFILGCNELNIYPEKLGSWDVEKMSWLSYNYGLSNIAKGLLRGLGRPNAPYLGMKALGKSFVYVRCHQDPIYWSWTEIVQHFFNEAQVYQRRLDELSKGTKYNEHFIYASTHDIANSKPLVQIMAETSRHDHHGLKECRICNDANVPWSTLVHEEYIVEHVRDVHLIANPVEKRHYSPHVKNKYGYYY